jgi:hypothetical protein
MGNLHAVAASAVTLTNAAEGVIATLTAFNENEAGEFAQGVVLQAGLNVTIGTGGVALVLRVRKVSLTGTLVGLAQTITVTAGNVVQASIDELDTTLIQPGIVYVLTGQVTSGSANSTVNRVVLTAEVASAFD